MSNNSSAGNILLKNCRGSWPDEVCGFANICGLCSTAIWFLVLLPQVWRCWRTKSIQGQWQLNRWFQRPQATDTYNRSRRWNAIESTCQSVLKSPCRTFSIQWSIFFYTVMKSQGINIGNNRFAIETESLHSPEGFTEKWISSLCDRFE